MHSFALCYLKNPAFYDTVLERLREVFANCQQCNDNMLLASNEDAVFLENIILLDGSIYNKSELTARYGIHENVTNMFLVGTLYEKLGSELFKELNGSFSVLIFDKMHNRIVAGIDHINQKSIYYYDDNDISVITNDIKPILSVVGREKIRCNRQGVLDYVAFLNVLGNDTFFKNLSRLLPGQLIEIELKKDSNKFNPPRTYWKLPFKEDVCRSSDFKDIANELRGLLVEELCSSLSAKSEKLVLALSGGLDSSTIAFLIKQILHKDFIAITGGFNEISMGNEITYGRETAAMLGVPFHEVIPTEQNFWLLLQKLTSIMDFPEGTSDIYGLFCIAEEASKHSAQVLIHGFGADILLGGSGSPLTSIVRYILGNLNIFKRHFPEISNVNLIFEFLKRRGHWVLLECLLRNSSNMWKACYDSIVHRHSLIYLNPDISPKDAKKRFKILFDEMEETDPLRSLMTFIIYDIREGQHGLNRVSQYFNIDDRAVFPGKKIIEYLSSVPFTYRIPLYTSKPLLKELSKDLLPSQILKREKRAFEHPFGSWIKIDKYGCMNDLLFTADNEYQALFDKKKIIKAYREHCSGESNHSLLFWQILSINSWFKTYNLHF